MAYELDIAAGDAQTHARASVLDRDIRRVCQEVRRVWIYLAGDLFEFHQDRCWEVLGLSSFEEWLADPDIDLHPRHVYRMMQVWRELVVERHMKPEALQDAEVTKVVVVLPALRAGKVSAEDALADAAALSRTDLQERYAGDLAAPLAAEDEPALCQCPACGKTHRAKR